MKKFLLPFILLFALSSQAQTGISDPVFSTADGLIKTFMQHYSIGGGEVAITKNGKLIIVARNNDALELFKGN